MRNPFRCFKTSPEIIRMAVMMYVRFPLSLRQVEDLLHERGIDICHETVGAWWDRFGPIFAAEIRKKRVAAHRIFHNGAGIWMRFLSASMEKPASFGGRSTTRVKSLNASSLGSGIARLH